jgi:GNAT superfamily N-acetyltransferase
VLQRYHVDYDDWSTYFQVVSVARIDQVGTTGPAPASGAGAMAPVRSVHVVRPASAELRDPIEAFCERCSDDSLYRRFHGGGRDATLRREVDRWVHPDASYRTVVAWADGEVHGVANLAIGRDGAVEAAVLVEDTWRRHGVAGRLLRRLASQARDDGFDAIHVDIQPDNHPALSLLGAMSGDCTTRFSGGSIEARIPLPPRPAQTARSSSAGASEAMRTTSTRTASSCLTPSVNITPLSGGTSE